MHLETFFTVRISFKYFDRLSRISASPETEQNAISSPENLAWVLSGPNGRDRTIEQLLSCNVEFSGINRPDIVCRASEATSYRASGRLQNLGSGWLCRPRAGRTRHRRCAGLRPGGRLAPQHADQSAKCLPQNLRHGTCGDIDDRTEEFVAQARKITEKRGLLAAVGVPCCYARLRFPVTWADGDL